MFIAVLAFRDKSAEYEILLKGGSQRILDLPINFIYVGNPDRGRPEQHEQHAQTTASE